MGKVITLTQEKERQYTKRRSGKGAVMSDSIIREVLVET